MGVNPVSEKRWGTVKQGGCPNPIVVHDPIASNMRFNNRADYFEKKEIHLSATTRSQAFVLDVPSFSILTLMRAGGRSGIARDFSLAQASRRSSQ